MDLHGFSIDFYQFWVVTDIPSKEKRNEVYLPAGRISIGQEYLALAKKDNSAARRLMGAQSRTALATYSTPLLYQTMHFLFGGDYEKDYQRYLLFSITCSLVSLFIFGFLANVSLVTVLAISIVYFGAFGAFQAEALVGNVNQIQLGFLASYLWTQSRKKWPIAEILAGLIIVLAILFKPNLILVYLLLLGARIYFKAPNIYKFLIGNILGSILGFCSSSLFFGTFWCWRYWVKSLADIDSVIYSDYGNISFLHLIQVRDGWNLIPLAGFCLFSLFAFGLFRRKARQAGEGAPDDFLLLGLGCIISVIAAKLVWAHYLILLMPVVFRLLSETPRAKYTPIFSAILFGALCLALFFMPWDIQIPYLFAACIGLYVVGVREYA